MRARRAPVRVLALFIAMAAEAAAQFPTLDAVLPRGGRRGTEVEVVLLGKKLDGARALLIEPGGIEVVSLESKDSKRVELRLALAPDAAPGPRALWLHTAAGITNLRTFQVGLLSEVAEVEPNGSARDAQAIALGCTVNGVADDEDVDLYAFEGAGGDRVSIELEGQRLGDRQFDAAVALLDDAGFALASCDDSALGRQDPVLSCVLPEDGRYRIQVRESAYRGAGDCRYRMHVGRFVRPLATLPLGGRAGEELALTLLGAGDGGGAVRALGVAHVTLPEARAHGGWVPDGVVAIAAGDAPTPSWLRVVDLDRAPEAEPNDGLKQATPFVAPAALEGVLGSAGDVDRYAFEARKDQSFEVEVFARRLRTPVDAVLAVQQPNGKTLVSNDDEGGGPDSRVSFRAPRDGTFVVTVRDHLRRGGPQFAYRIEVAPRRPSLALRIGGERQLVAVPRGGRAALVLAVERSAFGGAVACAIEGLPPGVTVTVPPVPAGIGAVPVLFEASADAEPASALCAVTSARVDGAEGDASTDIRGGLRQDVPLVLGRNNVPVWSHSIDRLPVAVCEPAPFSVRVEAPDVPLVRNGALSVQVIVERDAGFEGKGGFEGEVALELPFLPPGVDAVRQKQIAKDADRVTWDLAATGEAKLGEWRMLVTARAQTGAGLVQVASPYFAVRVVPQYLAFEVQPVAVERGAEAQMFVAVKRLEGFPGAATVRLVGLPLEVSSDALAIDGTTESLTFGVRTGAASPVGNHKTLQFQASFPFEGGEALQALAAAELRIQEPAPAPKPNGAAAPAAAPVAEPAAKPVAKPERPLTRLEKLRRDHARRSAERLAERGDGS